MRRPRREAQPLKQELVRLVKEGATVRAAQIGLDLSPGMVGNWRRRDAGFRYELTKAVENGTFLRTRAYHDAVGQAFLARVRMGEKVAELWGQPGMPSRATYEYWKRTQGTFAGEMARLRQGQRAQMAHRGRMARRDFDPAVGDRIYALLWREGSLARVLAADPALPCTTIVQRWRRESPEFDKLIRFALEGWRRRHARQRTRLTPELTETIVERIAAGASLYRLGAMADMPAEGTLYRWLATRPAFAEAVEMAYEMREDRAADAVLTLAEGARRGTVQATRRAMAKFGRSLSRKTWPRAMRSPQAL